MICKFNKTCPFFNNIMNVSSMKLKINRKKFCYDKNNRCARYIISEKIGEKLVPLDLFPDMNEKAKKILKMYKKV